MTMMNSMCQVLKEEVVDHMVVDEAEEVEDMVAEEEDADAAAEEPAAEEGTVNGNPVMLKTDTTPPKNMASSVRNKRPSSSPFASPEKTNLTQGRQPNSSPGSQP
jgi:hypothetical protein